MSGSGTRRSTRTVRTPVGIARVYLSRPAVSRGMLALGHGAGGGVDAPDLQAVRAAAVEAGWTVGLVEQPWRVAGGRVAPAPPRLDQAWLQVVRSLRAGRGALPGPLVVGGRSAGARVACRTAGELGAAGVVALAFPLHPPGRTRPGAGEVRAAELMGAVSSARQLLVVQGERDAFGSPGELELAMPAAAVLVAMPGDHSLKARPDAVGGAVAHWLATLRKE